jgi:hypothetical protein
MKASKQVANSEKGINEGKWPEATHVIIDEVENMEEKLLKYNLNRKLMLSLSKMSADDKASLCTNFIC